MLFQRLDALSKKTAGPAKQEGNLSTGLEFKPAKLTREELSEILDLSIELSMNAQPTKPTFPS